MRIGRVTGAVIGLAMLLAAGCGATITISADGADEVDALEALVRLVESGFGETSCSG